MPFEKDMQDSQRDFNVMIKTVLPEIKMALSSEADIFKVEFDPHPLLQALDQYSGIDYVLASQKKHLYGVASRIQWGVNYKTFTVRFKRLGGAKTEFEKRMEALKSGGEILFPAYTIQCYLSERGASSPDILSFGMIKTRRLYAWVSNNLADYIEQMEKRQRNYIGNPFLIIPWDDLRKKALLTSPDFFIYPDDVYIEPKQIEPQKKDVVKVEEKRYENLSFTFVYNN